MSFRMTLQINSILKDKNHLILVLCFFILYFFILLLPLKLLEPDDNTFKIGADLVSKGKLYFTKSEFETAKEEYLKANNHPIPLFIRNGDKFYPEKSPGWWFFLGIAKTIHIERYVILLFAIVFFVSFLLLRNHSSEEFSDNTILSGLLFLLTPGFITLLYRPYLSDFPAAALISLTGYLAYTSRKNLSFFFLGFFSGLAITFRYAHFPLILFFIVFSILMNKSFKNALFIAAGLAVSLFPLLLFFYKVTGSILGINYSYINSNKQIFSLFAIKRNFPKLLPILICAYPHLFILPFMSFSEIKKSFARSKLPVFLIIWFLIAFVPYLFFCWLRHQAYPFMARFELTGLVPLVLLSLIVLKSMKKKHSFALISFIFLFSAFSIFTFFNEWIINPTYVDENNKSKPKKEFFIALDDADESLDRLILETTHAMYLAVEYQMGFMKTRNDFSEGKQNDLHNLVLVSELVEQEIREPGRINNEKQAEIRRILRMIKEGYLYGN